MISVAVVVAAAVAPSSAASEPLSVFFESVRT